MTISLPIKAFLGGLAIIVSLASAAQAGRPLIQSEDACRDVAKYYDLSWGGAKSKYETKGCYYYANGKYAKTVWYGKGGWFGNQNANTGDGKQANGKRRFDQICDRTGEVSWKREIKTINPKWTGGWRKYSAIRSHNIICDCGNREGNKLFKFQGCSEQ